MSVESITVAAPSRLHFGLFSFGHDPSQPKRRNYGGVGVMIDSPQLKLSISRAEGLRASGPLADRAKQVAQRWIDAQHDIDSLNCHIEIGSAPPQHCGLGVGTQLAMSVVAGLNALHDRNCDNPQEHAQLAGRGRRSAVGVYGFLSGGLIVESGKLRGENLSPLDQRIDFPADWRFVLIRPAQHSGVSGQQEQLAFDALPAVEQATSRQLRDEVRLSMLPALADVDFDQFSQSVYRFGHTAGNCFATLQGGPYNGPMLDEIVQTARRVSVAGVGQSSWGPTIYCLLPSVAAARDFIGQMPPEFGGAAVDYAITAANNSGARIEQQQSAKSAGRQTASR